MEKMHNVQSIIKKFLIQYYRFGEYDSVKKSFSDEKLDDMASKRAIEIGRAICDYCEGTRIDVFNKEKECPFCLENKNKIEEVRKGVEYV